MDFFEGTEKLLEIWFTKSTGKMTLENDLRIIPRDVLDYILELVNCKILSTSKTRDLDSYGLSESSLFINKRRSGPWRGLLLRSLPPLPPPSGHFG